MPLELRRLCAEDGQDLYEMLQELPADENGYLNSVYGKTFEEYKNWLKKAAAAAEQEGIVDGWKVPSSTFWLFENGRPVGMGRVRHILTDALRENGGNVGYSIRPDARGRGLGKKLLALLLEKCKDLGVAEVLLTIQNHNRPSIGVALANGGKIKKITEEKHYIGFELTL